MRTPDRPDPSRPDPARLRVGDAEREHAAAALADHYARGRLSQVEHAERLDAAWSARTRADLDALFHDLPVPQPSTAAVPDRERVGAAPWVVVLAVLGVLLVLTRIPWLLVALAVIAFVAVKHRRRAGRSGPPVWR